METVVCILGIVNVCFAIFNTKGKKEIRMFSLFAGAFSLVAWFIMVS